MLNIEFGTSMYFFAVAKTGRCSYTKNSMQTIHEQPPHVNIHQVIQHDVAKVGFAVKRGAIFVIIDMHQLRQQTLTVTR